MEYSSECLCCHKDSTIIVHWGLFGYTYSQDFIHSHSTNPNRRMKIQLLIFSAVLQVAFVRLASPKVLDFFRARKLDETLLDRLNTKLLFIDALADDAELKQFRDPHVK